ncbi:MAG: taurine dioxygenase [Gammaproteobacteria bacterium]|jgi:taurine dioxygenase
MSISNSLDIKPLSAAVGAVVSGVDLREPVDEDALATMRTALGEHGVLVFRDQDLTPDQHLAFAKQWSNVNINRFFTPVDGHPEIAEVLKEPDQQRNIGGGWHTDHSYDTEPAMGSMLFAREVPPHGGDTLFASMFEAYEALSDGLKEMLGGLNAVHSSRHVFGPGARRYADPGNDIGTRIGNQELATQDAVHPVVIKHPISGRKSLYVNPGFTVRFDCWTDEESAPLLAYLYKHAAMPEFTGRLNWEKGSLAFWDNRATWHYALNDYQGHRRHLHRITLEGEALHR